MRPSLDFRMDRPAPGFSMGSCLLVDERQGPALAASCALADCTCADGLGRFAGHRNCGRGTLGKPDGNLGQFVLHDAVDLGTLSC